jgi:hypothetical protein
MQSPHLDLTKYESFFKHLINEGILELVTKPIDGRVYRHITFEGNRFLVYHDVQRTFTLDHQIMKVNQLMLPNPLFKKWFEGYSCELDDVFFKVPWRNVSVTPESTPIIEELRKYFYHRMMVNDSNARPSSIGVDVEKGTLEGEGSENEAAKREVKFSFSAAGSTSVGYVMVMIRVHTRDLYTDLIMRASYPDEVGSAVL